MYAYVLVGFRRAVIFSVKEYTNNELTKTKNKKKQKIRKNKIKIKRKIKLKNKPETFFEKCLIFFVLFCQFLLN